MTVIRFKAGVTRRRTLLSKNPIASAFDKARTIYARVKCWRRNNDHMTRWGGVALVEAEKGLRAIGDCNDIAAFMSKMKHCCLPY